MSKRVFLIGYGNPGRQDDGLGQALAQRLESQAIPNLDIDMDYQLAVEHAADLAAYDVVIFADATIEDTPSFYFRPLAPGAPATFSTHSISPGGVLRLARDLFQATTEAYEFGIKGYEFDRIEEGLTPAARLNLDAAARFLADRLQKGDFSARVT